MTRNKSKHGNREFLYMAYRVTSPDHETKIVFAAGIWSAVGVLLQWRYANEIGEVPFTVDPTWATGLTGVARQHLDAARASCRAAGIGTRYRADAGWGIAVYPYEHEDPG